MRIMAIAHPPLNANMQIKIALCQNFLLTQDTLVVSRKRPGASQKPDPPEQQTAVLRSGSCVRTIKTPTTRLTPSPELWKLFHRSLAHTHNSPSPDTNPSFSYPQTNCILLLSTLHILWGSNSFAYCNFYCCCKQTECFFKFIYFLSVLAKVFFVTCTQWLTMFDFPKSPRRRVVLTSGVTAQESVPS